VTLRQAIQLRPSHAEAYDELGYALHQLKRYPEAIVAYKNAIQNKANYGSAHYNLGMSYIEMNDRAGALAEYRILQQIDAPRAEKLLKAIK